MSHVEVAMMLSTFFALARAMDERFGRAPHAFGDFCFLSDFLVKSAFS